MAFGIFGWDRLFDGGEKRVLQLFVWCEGERGGGENGENKEGGGKGEMSRFMLQTLAEKEDLLGAGQKIDLRVLSAVSETKEPEAISVKKDKRVMEQLHQRFNHEKILSPSAINTYMSCPLKFYFNYVVGLRPIDEVSDDVDKAMFGTIFHDVMHHLYKPYEGKTFLSTEANAIAENDKKSIQNGTASSSL